MQPTRCEPFSDAKITELTITFCSDSGTQTFLDQYIQIPHCVLPSFTSYTHFSVPPTRTRFGRYTRAHYVTDIFNVLPSEITSCESVRDIRKNFKRIIRGMNIGVISFYLRHYEMRHRLLPVYVTSILSSANSPDFGVALIIFIFSKIVTLWLSFVADCRVSRDKPLRWVRRT